jgi:hypothetical protein
MIKNRNSRHQSDASIVSPFEHAEAAVEPKRTTTRKIVLWCGLGLLLLAVGVIGGVVVTQTLNDPYRTLQVFPVAKYLDSPRALAGSRFKAELRVEADLAWKEEAGRLMLFSTADDSRRLAVLIPATVAREIYFTKGQSYLAEIEVKEGGLIYANSIRKN